jgi:hypothetical protein
LNRRAITSESMLASFLSRAVYASVVSAVEQLAGQSIDAGLDIFFPSVTSQVRQIWTRAAWFVLVSSGVALRVCRSQMAFVGDMIDKQSAGSLAAHEQVIRTIFAVR